MFRFMVQHNRYTGYRSKRSGRRTLPRLSENIGEKQWQITRSDMWAAMWKYGTAANFSSAQIPRAKPGRSFRHKNAPAFTEAFVRQLTERIGADALCFVMLLCHMAQLQAAPLAPPLGEPSSARNALHRTVYRSAPVLSVRQTGISRFFTSNALA